MTDLILTDAERAFVEELRLNEAMASPEAGHVPTVYRYIRCSHQDSVDSGLGLAVQEDVTMKYAELLVAKSPGLTISNERLRDEGVSAHKYKISERPAGGRLRKIARRGDHIVFAKLDRGFRDAADAKAMLNLWQRCGIAAHFVDTNIDMSSPYGPMMLAFAAEFAELQARQTSIQNLAIAEKQRQQGRPTNGSCPAGFKIVGKKGQRRFVLRDRKDKDNPLIMGELFRRMHDEEGMTFEKLALWAEQYLARVENRKMRQYAERKWKPDSIQAAYKLAVKVHNGEPLSPITPKADPT